MTEFLADPPVAAGLADPRSPRLGDYGAQRSGEGLMVCPQPTQPQTLAITQYGWLVTRRPSLAGARRSAGGQGLLPLHPDYGVLRAQLDMGLTRFQSGRHSLARYMQTLLACQQLLAMEVEYHWPYCRQGGSHIPPSRRWQPVAEQLAASRPLWCWLAEQPDTVAGGDVLARFNGQLARWHRHLGEPLAWSVHAAARVWPPAPLTVVAMCRLLILQLDITAQGRQSESNK